MGEISVLNRVFKIDILRETESPRKYPQIEKINYAALRGLLTYLKLFPFKLKNFNVKTKL